MDEETKAVSDAFLKGVNGLLNDLQGPSSYSSYDRSSVTISTSPQFVPSVNKDASAPFFALKSGDSTVPGIATELSHEELYPRPPPCGVRQKTSLATYTSPLPARSTAPQTKTHSPLYALPPGMSLHHTPPVAKHVEQPASYSTKELATPAKNDESENEAAQRLSARIASTREYLERGGAHHSGSSGLRSSGSFGGASPGASLDASGDAQQSHPTRPHPPPPPEEEEDGPPQEPVLSAHTVLSPVPTAYQSHSSQNERAIEEPSFGFDSPRRGRDRNAPISISLGSVPVNASASSSSSSSGAKPFSMTRANVSDLKSPKTIATSPEKNPSGMSVDHEAYVSGLAGAQKLVVFFAAQMGLSSSSAMRVNDVDPGSSSMVSRSAALQRIDWSPSVMAVLKAQVIKRL